MPSPTAGPGNHGVRLDDDERVPPARPQLGQAGPEETVDRPQAWAFGVTVVEHRKLLAEGKDLELQSCPAVQGHKQGLKQGNHDSAHTGHATPAWPKTSMISRRTEFLVGTGLIFGLSALALRSAFSVVA